MHDGMRACMMKTVEFQLRVYFWMAMQMMKGIVVILAINHYLSNLGHAALLLTGPQPGVKNMVWF